MFVDTNLQVDVIELTEVSYLWVEKLKISWTDNRGWLTLG